MVSAPACATEGITSSERLWITARKLPKTKTANTAHASGCWGGVSNNRGGEKSGCDTVLPLLPAADEIYGGTWEKACTTDKFYHAENKGT